MSKKWFWITMSILALSGILISILVFDNAFPIVNVPISMDKNMAIQNSDSLTASLNPDFKDYRSTAIFTTEENFKHYVELEGGGVDSLQEIMNAGIYSPYTWKVRQFTPGELYEITYTFMPNGELYGFNMTLPDSLAGKNILKENMFLDKISFNHGELIPDLSNYKLVEHSTELKSGGRRDHLLTYERQDITVHEARLRIQLRISGDELTMVKAKVKIPESFTNEFKEMRSINNTVAAVGEIVMILLYGLLGVAGAWFIMMKKGSLQLKGPLTWAIIIAVLIFLSGMTSLPLSWFSYDTSFSAGQFVFQNIMGALLQGLLIGVIFFLSATAGEGLGRQAFPQHLQFWKVWSKDLGASDQVLQQTVFGYLWALFMVGFITLFYWFTNNILGWWSPAENMMDPNILGMSLPWLSPAAMSTQAGFWEETLFRAVPLAGALVIGRKFKHKTLWLVFVLMLQAIIFGSMHANYAQQPSYARIVEMFIPFVLYGLVYINWGLLPVVISHFVYDIVLMEMPLFLVSSPGIWVNRILAIICALVPIGIVLVLRIKRGEKYQITARDMNMGVIAKTNEKAQDSEKKIINSSGKYKGLPIWTLLVLIALGFIAWFGFSQFKMDQKTVGITKNEALMIAHDYVSERVDDSLFVSHEDYILMDKWNRNERMFVWENGKSDLYNTVFSEILPINYYNISFKSYRGNAEEKAEQLVVYVDEEGKVIYYQHIVPEKRPGASLEEDEARRIAERELQDYCRFPVSTLDPVSVTPSKLESRTDWFFVYRDTSYQIGEGDIRYKVGLAGDQLIRLSTRVNIPEEWQRETKKAGVMKGVLRSISGVVSFAIMVGILILGIIAWTKKGISLKTMWTVLIVLFLASLASGLLSVDSVMASMPTTVIFQNIVVLLVLSMGIGVLLVSMIYAIFAGYLFENIIINEKSNLRIIAIGLSGGLLIAGVNALTQSPLFIDAPTMLAFDNAASLSPLLSNLMDTVGDFIRMTIKLISIVVLVNLVTEMWSKRKVLGIAMLILFGISFAPAFSVGTWLFSGLMIGLIYAVLYVFLFRQNITAVPWACAVVLVLENVRLLAVQPVAGMALIIWLSIFLLLVLAIISHYFIKGLKTEQALK